MFSIELETRVNSKGTQYDALVIYYNDGQEKQIYKLLFLSSLEVSLYKQLKAIESNKK